MTSEYVGKVTALATRFLSACGTLVILMAAAASVAQAQIAGLSAEQQRLLNQLPPSQRQELLRRVAQSQTASRAESISAPNDQYLGAGAAETSATDERSDEEVTRFGPDDTLVVIVERSEGFDLDPDVEELAKSVESGNPYILDRRGRLNVDGIDSIQFAGLTEEQARVRLAAEPSLSGLDLLVFRLPVVKFGTASLELFGYEFFDSDRDYVGPQHLPTPVAYVMGVGDVVSLLLYGKSNAQYELAINREGVLAIPDIGPVNAAGLSYDALRAEVEALVERQLPGTDVSLTLAALRSAQVTLVGDVNEPGTITVGSLSKIIDALVIGGGVSERGSLRNIQLRRNGQTIARLDLYQLLLFGSDRSNRQIRSGDVIFVPPIGSTVSVSGDVTRPAIYEIRDDLDLEGAITLAGGVRDTAKVDSIRLERRDPVTGLRVVEASLRNPADLKLDVSGGDAIIVPGETGVIDAAIELFGHVRKPGLYGWSKGLKLTSVLRHPDDLLPEADMNYVVIKRELTPNGRIEVRSVDLSSAFSDPSADMELESRDEIYVFEIGESREQYLKGISDQLTRQSSSEYPSPLVRVSGLVKVPGVYPLEPGMRVSDLLRAGGGLAEAAFTERAELSRNSSQFDSQQQTSLLSVDLQAVLGGDQAADMLLRSFDFLNIKEIPRWNEDKLVEIRGQVNFPGIYPVHDGEGLSSLLDRAGGLTEFAFPEGAVFTRTTLAEREKEQLEVLADRVESDLSALALSDPGQIEALSIGNSLLAQLRNTEPAGRLVIDLNALLAGDKTNDIFLRDGDRLIVPQVTQEVTVLGEVQYATSHLWEPGLSREDYIGRSGGVTVRADVRRIYVVRANGEVVVNSRSRFFSRSQGFDIRAGDTVVVPVDTDRVKPLVLWTSVTQILYNVAIAAAAVQSF